MTYLKRRHHHVWQHYLKAWSADGKIWCSQNGGQPFLAATKNIGVERDFYKLHQLTIQDLKFIDGLFKSTYPVLASYRREFINLLMFPFSAAQQAREKGRSEKEVNLLIDEWCCNIMEDQHSRIEDSFVPILASLHLGDLDFYNDERGNFTFTQYIATQYVRTKKIKEAMRSELTPINPLMGDRLWPITSALMAMNVSYTLSMERNRRRLVLIKNATPLPLITGDQPAINLMDRLAGFEIYYPISPTRAIVVCHENADPSIPTELGEHDVIGLNQRIRNESFAQVFGCDNKLL